MSHLSQFFIHRPNFAIVISIVITLAGLLALSVIPIAQYPNLTPPQVTVSATYPGASADTLMKTVAQPIEEQVNGVPDMIYMQSTSSSSGTYSLQVTFAAGTDPNIDQVNVQNRVQLAVAQLPTEVQQEGLTVRAAASNFVLAVNLADYRVEDCLAPKNGPVRLAATGRKPVQRPHDSECPLRDPAEAVAFFREAFPE